MQPLESRGGEETYPQSKFCKVAPILGALSGPQCENPWKYILHFLWAGGSLIPPERQPACMKIHHAWLLLGPPWLLLGLPWLLLVSLGSPSGYQRTSRPCFTLFAPLWPLGAVYGPMWPCMASKTKLCATWDLGDPRVAFHL